MRSSTQVLVLASDEFSFCVRLKPLLDVLVSEGSIAGYGVLDRDLAPLAPLPDGRFNVAIAQRNPGSTPFRWLKASGVPFLYDVDDLITEGPFRKRGRPARHHARVAWCTSYARAVFTPSTRLRDELMKSVGVDFAARHALLPNGLTPLRPPIRRRPARRLVWVSSDLPLIEREMPGFASIIAGIAKRLGLKPLLIGRFGPEMLQLFADVSHIPAMRFDAFRSLLSTLDDAIAIAPLPTALGADQVFVDCKSDIKVVDFQGHGIPAVYSRAVPYLTSDLAPQLLVPNEAAAWEAAVERLATHEASQLPEATVLDIHHLRSFAHLAGSLREAIDAAASADFPAPRPSLSGLLRRVEYRVRLKLQGRP